MKHLLTENRDGALWATFNRPEVFNSISTRMACELLDMWEWARSDAAIKLVVLTGAGDRAFCSGGDLKQLIPLLTGARQPQDDYDRRFLEPGVASRITIRDDTFCKPIIAAVNGVAMGGGSELAVASDIRIASTNARFGLSEPKVGIVAGGGTTVRLPRQVPWCQAMEFLLTGESITAEQALAMGLINRVVEPAQLLAEVQRVIDKLLDNAPLALQAIKRIALESSGVSLQEGFRIEDRELAAVLATEDAREGPRAFAEKRKPHFVGR